MISGKKSKNPEREPLLRNVTSRVEGGDYRLLASTLVYPEVLARKHTKEAIKDFHDTMRNSERVKVLSADVMLAQKAQEIRNRVKSLKVPDAIHLATAIFGGAQVFHTFDKKLWPLDGEDDVDGLRITECTIPGTPVSEIPQG